MAVSLEALAMAGVDCLDCKITIEELERKYMLQPGPHLLLPKQKKRKLEYQFPFTFRLSNLNGERRVCDAPEDNICLHDDDHRGTSTNAAITTTTGDELGESLGSRKGKKIKRSMKKIAMFIKRIIRKVSGVLRMATRKRKETLPIKIEG
ncbi:hypothetical protein ACSBR2_029501 [Camellia fascicularis]